MCMPKQVGCFLATFFLSNEHLFPYVVDFEDAGVPAHIFLNA